MPRKENNDSGTRVCFSQKPKLFEVSIVAVDSGPAEDDCEFSTPVIIVSVLVATVVSLVLPFASKEAQDLQAFDKDLCSKLSTVAPAEIFWRRDQGPPGEG